MAVCALVVVVHTVLRPPLPRPLPVGTDTKVVDSAGVVADPWTQLPPTGTEIPAFLVDMRHTTRTLTPLSRLFLPEEPRLLGQTQLPSPFFTLRLLLVSVAGTVLRVTAA